MDLGSHSPDPSSGGPSSRVTLSLRGQRLTLERNALMEMPESVLLCLFPNGVVLSAPMQGRGDWDDVGEGAEGEEGEEVYPVDFDGPCLQYILNFFSKARLDFYGPPEAPKRPYKDFSEPNPLFHKQAIIVLREELEYFAIPPKKQDGENEEEEQPKTDADGLPNDKLLELKKDCGEALLERKSIFTALQRNVNRENNVAEQHLIDMLCMSGFDRGDEWGYRAMEPSRCCITSIALVLLKTGIGEPSSPSQQNGSGSPTEGGSPEGEVNGEPSVNAQQLATAQKLLLFWRKPARKCWWDATDISLPRSDKSIKVWARRVWTLELSLI